MAGSTARRPPRAPTTSSKGGEGTVLLEGPWSRHALAPSECASPTPERSARWRRGPRGLRSQGTRRAMRWKNVWVVAERISERDVVAGRTERGREGRAARIEGSRTGRGGKGARARGCPRWVTRRREGGARERRGEWTRGSPRVRTQHGVKSPAGWRTRGRGIMVSPGRFVRSRSRVSRGHARAPSGRVRRATPRSIGRSRSSTRRPPMAPATRGRSRCIARSSGRSGSPPASARSGASIAARQPSTSAWRGRSVSRWSPTRHAWPCSSRVWSAVSSR